MEKLREMEEYGIHGKCKNCENAKRKKWRNVEKS
jgi:hypothetical protein